MLEETRFLLDDNETFRKALEDGTLNHKFAGRLTMKMLAMLKDVEERSSW